MTATILKNQATQATRSISFTIPATTPDPKFSFGDRVGCIIDDNPDDPDTHVGVVASISLEGGEWKYQVLPGDDEELRDLCNCSNPEDFAWFDEDEIGILDDLLLSKIEFLLSNQKSYDQRRAEYLILAHAGGLDGLSPTSIFDYKESRQEWNELMAEGYIPESLGYMTV